MSILLNFIYWGRYKRVYIGKNVILRGDINIGRKSLLFDNVTVRGNCSLGENVILSENVEVRTSTSCIFIDDGSAVNRNSLVIGKVNIGKKCAIAPNCVIVGSNHRFTDLSVPICDQGVETKGIVIEDDVWIGANVTILDGVFIGEGTVIGAGSVVTKNIPARSIAVGNPCNVIKTRD